MSTQSSDQGFDQSFDIVGIDMPCLDLNVGVDVFPKPNEGRRVRQHTWQGGGKVATGLVAAARLGARCAIIGAVGGDLYGKFCAGDLARHGVDVAALKVDPPKTTSLSVVVSDRESGGRSILSHPGSVTLPPLDDAARAMIRRAKCLFLASASGVHAEAAQIARESGVKVLMDADDTSPAMLGMIPRIDWFIASEYFYQHQYGDGDFEHCLRALADQGPEVVVFTLGAGGCAGLSKEGSKQGFFRLPAFRVDVVDTVGAGDVFHGAFAAAYTRGGNAEGAARYASAVAAIKCTRIGGRAGIPDDATVERFLRDGFIDYTEIDRRVEFYQRGLEHV